MSRKQQPVWLFVVVLAALFAASVAAPRTWRGMEARHAPRSVAAARSSAGTWTRAPVLASPITAVEAHLLAAPLRSSLAVAKVLPAHPAIATRESIARSELCRPSITPPTPPAASSPDAAPATTVVAFHPKPGRKPAIQRVRHVAQMVRHEPPSVWGEPSLLLDQLDRLTADCDSGEWAARVADLVRELCRGADLRSPRTALALKRLRDLSDANHPLFAPAARSSKMGDLRRLHYAVLRRLDLWELVPELADRRPKTTSPGQTVSHSPPAPRSPRSILGVDKLLRDLERFEQTGLTDDGRELAADVVKLASQDVKLNDRTRRWLEWNYRNSNLRIVFSKELLNRLVPAQPAVEEPVHDRILGVPTRGWSTSTARVGIRLVPDPRQLHFVLEAKGIVYARTTSRRDPVTLYNNSDSAYVARKQLQLSAAGLKSWPAEADVTNSSRLRGIETDYDDVPFLGLLVEGIARAKHAESEPAVRRVARRKVAQRVQEVVDSAIEPKLVQARQLYERRVLATLAGLALEPSVIEMQTTEARMTSRLRLAGDEQLAASTPRPMAWGDSFASLQMHQSLVNNISDRLNLDGHTFTLPELQKKLVNAFKLPPEALSEEYPTDLTITFAKRDSITARFDDGRIELTLSIAELHKFPKSWRDFQVRVFYRPRINGLDVRFVRDGTVQLRGERFGRDPQIALRGIFSKVFSHDRELVLVDSRLIDDPRLVGLSVTQFVVTDGWIGLSLGHGSLLQARRTVGPLY
jgi:hypothetical protein